MTAPLPNSGGERFADVPSRMLRAQTALRLYGPDHPAFRAANAASTQALVAAAEASANHQITLCFAERTTMIETWSASDEAGRDLGDAMHAAGIAQAVVRSSVTAADVEALIKLVLGGWSHEDSDRLAAVTGQRIVARGVAQVASELTASGSGASKDWSGVIRKLMGENPGDEWSDIDEAAASAAIQSAMESGQIEACVEQLASSANSRDQRKARRASSIVQKLVAQLNDDQVANLLRLDQSLDQSGGSRLASVASVLPVDAIKNAIEHLTKCGKAPPPETLLLLTRLTGLGGSTTGSPSRAESPTDTHALDVILKARHDDANYTPEDYKQDLLRSAADGVAHVAETRSDLSARWTRPLWHALGMLEQMLRSAKSAPECAAIMDALEPRMFSIRLDPQDLERLRSVGSAVGELAPIEAQELVRSRLRGLLGDDRLLADIERDLRENRLQLGAVRWLLAWLDASQFFRMLSAISAGPDGRGMAEELIMARAAELDSILACLKERPGDAAVLAAFLAGAVAETGVAPLCLAVLPVLAESPGEAESIIAIADKRLGEWPADLTIATLRSPVDAVLRTGIRRAATDDQPRVQAALMSVLAGDMAESMDHDRHLAIVEHWARQLAKPKAAIRQLISHELRTLRPSAMARATRLTRALLRPGLKCTAPQAPKSPELRRSA